MPQIILASTSPYRKQLLQQLSISFETCKPDLNEDLHKSPELGFPKYTEKLAILKAKSLIDKFPDSIIIGSDQALFLDNHICEKPKSIEKAINQLQFLSGKTHKLVTSVALVYKNELRTFSDITELTMRNLSLEEISRYINTDMPLDCAGSYKLEKQGISLFTKIKSEDHTAIIGLPLMALCQHLRELEVKIP